MFVYCKLDNIVNSFHVLTVYFSTVLSFSSFLVCLVLFTRILELQLISSV